MTIGDEAIIFFKRLCVNIPTENQRKEHLASLNFDVTDCRFQLTVHDHDQFIKCKWKWEVFIVLQELQELLLWQMNILICLTAGRISTFAFRMHPSSWFKAPNKNKFWLNKFTISNFATWFQKFHFGMRSIDYTVVYSTMVKFHHNYQFVLL